MNSYISKLRKEVLNAGVEIPDGASLYRPGGYPQLGLAPLSVKLSMKSSAKLIRQVEKAERDRGNVLFSTSGLGQLDIRLANELCSVFLGLAERFRDVAVEGINFHAKVTSGPNPAVALNGAFSDQYPSLYAVAVDMGEPSVREVIMAVYTGQYDRDTFKRVDCEMSKAPWSVYRRNALSNGYIELSECAAHPVCSAIYHAHAEVRNAVNARKERPLPWPATSVSRVSANFVHEFGHAVEYALLAESEENWKYVIGVLEECILRNPNGNGRWRVSDRKLKAAGLTRSDARLLNYPRALGRSPYVGGEWLRNVRKTVGWEMSREIGSYAQVNLDECFAEAFTQSIISSVPTTRRQLAPFQEALYEVGLSVKRRRNV
jgi:hypothetical protein